MVRSRSLNFFPIRDRALSTCCCPPAEASHTGHTLRLHTPPPHPLSPRSTHPLCGRSETPVCKAGWRCRSWRPSSASGSSRTSLVFLLTVRQDSARGRGGRVRTGQSDNVPRKACSRLTFGTSISQMTSSEPEEAVWSLWFSPAPIVQPLSTESMLFTSEPGTQGRVTGVTYRATRPPRSRLPLDVFLNENIILFHLLSSFIVKLAAKRIHDDIILISAGNDSS